MFYLSNKKIKLFIISILLLIFCFVLGIFDVKANEGNLEIFEPQDLQYAYKENGSTYTENLTIAPDDFDYVEIYDLFYASATESYVENKSPRAYYSIRGIINNSNTLRYLAFIVYSPTQLELNKLEVCLYLQNGSETCTLNDGSFSHTSVTEVLLNGTTSSYFYLIKTNGFTINQSYSNPIIKYGLNWNGVSTLYTTLPNSYLISGLLNFENETDRDNWLSSYLDYLQNYAPEEPDLPDNPILSPYIDTSSWPSDIGGWGHSFDSNANISTLITMPITLLQAIINHVNDTCTSFSLGSLYNTNLYLPCVSINRYLGNDLTHIIDLMIAGVIIFKIGKKFVVIFNDFTNLRDTQISELYGGGK